MHIALQTFGCKLNQAETDELKKDLIKLGLSIVPIEHGEDIAIVRACAVTCGASQSTREMIRRLKRNGAYVIAVGCLENKNLPEIDLVAKNNEEVKTIVIHLVRAKEKLVKNPPPTTYLSSDKQIIDRTRALIKIQNGCNFNCAYCIVPAFRGQSKSIATKEIIKKIKEVEKEGYLEIVLTGINICHYRDKETDLAGLLKQILTQTTVPRIRLGSLDPRLISHQLIDLYSQHSRLLPHWHLSLQSGSDTILKQMNRRYTAKKYLEIVNKLRKNNPLFSFTTDIILGFPGETEEDFAKTCTLLKKIQFAKVHIFPFSPRPGTKAAEMKNKLQDKIKTERVKKLKKITEIVANNFAKKFIGHPVEVLWENKKSGIWYGYTPEYLRVKCKSKKNLRNKITSYHYTL